MSIYLFCLKIEHWSTKLMVCVCLILFYGYFAVQCSPFYSLYKCQILKAKIDNKTNGKKNMNAWKSLFWNENKCMRFEVRMKSKWENSQKTKNILIKQISFEWNTKKILFIFMNFILNVAIVIFGFFELYHIFQKECFCSHPFVS